MPSLPLAYILSPHSPLLFLPLLLSVLSRTLSFQHIWSTHVCHRKKIYGKENTLQIYGDQKPGPLSGRSSSNRQMAILKITASDIGKLVNKRLSAHQPIPLFCPPYVIPHPPIPYAIRAWWTSSTGKEVGLESPPGRWRPPLAGAMRPSCCSHWWLASWPGRFRPATSISTRAIATPILYAIAL